MAVLSKNLLKAADAVIGATLCRLIGLQSPFLPQPPYPPVRAGELRRILLLRPGGIGDMLLLLPVIEFLRKSLPRAELRILCETRNMEVLGLAGLQAYALAYDLQPLRCLRALRSGSFDVCIDTEQFHHFSAVMARTSGAPVRVGFKINPVRNPLYTHLVDYAPDADESSQFRALLRPLGLPGEAPAFTGILRDVPLPGPRQLAAHTGEVIAMHIGGSAAYKRWPAARFAEVAIRLHRETRASCVLLGDRNDHLTAREVLGQIEQHDAPGINLAGELSLPETAAAIRRSTIFLGVDSGLAHLAVALDRPAVVLFGATDSRKWGFEDRRRAIVRQDISCSPCCIFGYHKPCSSIACMDMITTDKVLERCRGILAAAGR
jgi:ADP-heptose:LPS heptosyltransferase